MNQYLDPSIDCQNSLYGCPTYKVSWNGYVTEKRKCVPFFRNIFPCSTTVVGKATQSGCAIPPTLRVQIPVHQEGFSRSVLLAVGCTTTTRRAPRESLRYRDDVVLDNAKLSFG